MISLNRILIVEDEIEIAELERDYLELNGYQVDIVKNGTEGLNKAREILYSLIILDVMLPDMDGYEICKKIREFSDLPIIMVTAKNEDIDMIRGLGKGADDYIEKPFNPNELIARVKAHISRYERLVSRTTSEHEEIKTLDLNIKPVSRKVYVKSDEKILTAKEFDLLVLLASNPNQVFTKEQLLERVWGYDFFGDITTVTVHIRRLREKIEENPSQPIYIETVWGVGYRFKQ